jgi:hypothetical protein
VSAYRLVLLLAKKDRSYERNQYFPRSAHRAVDVPGAPLDAQAETAVSWVSITEDVPVLWIDYAAAESKLPGVWQAFYGGCLLKEMSRGVVLAPRTQGD